MLTKQPLFFILWDSDLCWHDCIICFLWICQLWVSQALTSQLTQASSVDWVGHWKQCNVHETSLKVPFSSTSNYGLLAVKWATVLDLIAVLKWWLIGGQNVKKTLPVSVKQQRSRFIRSSSIFVSPVFHCAVLVKLCHCSLRFLLVGWRGTGVVTLSTYFSSNHSSCSPLTSSINMGFLLWSRCTLDVFSPPTSDVNSRLPCESLRRSAVSEIIKRADWDQQSFHGQSSWDCVFFFPSLWCVKINSVYWPVSKWFHALHFNVIGWFG